MKTDAHKVSQVLRIAQKIQKLPPAERRKAARYFCLWVKIINRQPIFEVTNQKEIDAHQQIAA